MTRSPLLSLRAAQWIYQPGINGLWIEAQTIPATDGHRLNNLLQIYRSAHEYALEVPWTPAHARLRALRRSRTPPPGRPPRRLPSAPRDSAQALQLLMQRAG